MPKIYERLSLESISCIPPELLERPQWVAWRLKPGEKGKFGKVPVNPKTGRDASPTDPATWETAVKTINFFATTPGMQGIGFVFSASDPFVGIDIDDCRNMMSGDIFDWAKKILEKLNSYTEASPSGTGVHILARAESPGKLHRRNRVEIYNSARFFTITGKPIDRYVSIRECTTELYEVYKEYIGSDEEKPDHSAAPMSDAKLELVRGIPDEKLIAIASRSKNGFAHLWEGNAADYGDDLSRATAALLMHLAYWTRADAERMDKLMRQSGLMRGKWDTRRGVETWGWREIENAIAKQKKFYDPEIEKLLLMNDTSNVEIFAGIYKGQFAWIDKWKQWISWKEICWEREANLEVYEATETVQSEVAERASQIDALDKPLIKFVQQTGDGWRRAAIEKWARPKMTLAHDILDCDPLLLACANGVLDLRTGYVRPGRREDYITRQVRVKYNPEAKCPLFDKFVAEIMLGRDDLISYLWRVIGYTLTGSTSERTFYILHGSGRNGKSTLVNVLSSLLGQYCRTTSFITFAKKRFTSDNPREDVAHLAGARMVVAQEADEEMTLDTALLKALTGGDTFTARFLYGASFEFHPQFKLFLVTNHVPKIQENAHALWDRLHYIPFDYRVEESHVDPQLGTKLLMEMEGILARAVEGSREWYENGLMAPARVTTAREELKEKNDRFSEALQYLTVGVENASVKHSVLYSKYAAWSKENGERYALSSKALSQYLAMRAGVVKDVRGANVLWWRGIGLRAD